VAEVTNYIDRLVAELCPDGVEYRPLSDVVEKNYGGGTPSKAKEEYWGGDIPWASVGDLSNDLMEIFDTRSKITPAGVSGSSTNVVPAGAVIVAIKIAPGKMKIAGVDLAINQDIRGLVLNDLMNARFLTYYFRTLRFAGHGTIVKSITNKRLMDTEVPVPPLEIQEAIVEILDKFTNLEAELEAELEARTLQYEYYRDSLFEALDCPRATLGELGKFYGGLKGKTKNDFGSSGARYISYKNVYENISADFTWPDFVQVKEGENQLSLMKGDILLTGSSENMEEAGLSSVVTKEPEEEAYLNSFSICYRLNDPSILNPEFSKYLFRSRLARKQIIRTAQGVTRFNVSKKKLANVSVPIPTLEEQQRIVDILDRFDALTSSLSEGLPAELAARRSQYEYYRDQLLTFPRKGENQ
jgi:restriction modification system DNA specificity domain protein